MEGCCTLTYFQIHDSQIWTEEFIDNGFIIYISHKTSESDPPPYSQKQKVSSQAKTFSMMKAYSWIETVRIIWMRFILV